MKFGPVSLDQAEGAVLAHSVAVSGGRLRKGRVLEAADVMALREAGFNDVIVARLDPGDLDENTAALRLAQAVAGQAKGLRLTQPFTGRVNILAEGPGVAVLDVAALEAVNAIDPMITIATVPQGQQLADGGMLATIKIISYAVPEAAVDLAGSSYGGLDILVNNAGVFLGTEFEAATDDEWDRIIDINLKGVYLGTRVCAPASWSAK